jgi:hypothetical protein
MRNEICQGNKLKLASGTLAVPGMAGRGRCWEREKGGRISKFEIGIEWRQAGCLSYDVPPRHWGGAVALLLRV